MNSFYQVGGSLDEIHPTYIKRQADEDLYENLLAGNFCYVLTSRQMGKSSLRVRVKKRLEEDGFRCSSIDLTEIGSHNITVSQWYYAILDRLIVDLELTEVVDLDDLWAQYQNLAPLQRLNKFVTTILFTHVTTPIVIFVDEIDSIIDLKFDTDDFFAWIRYCYNFRTDNLDYKRLTFCLLGVATPTDLIKNKSRTSYNIGESIEPLRFQENELNPLMEGLPEQVANLARVQSEIYKWTGGQPLLTQRLCQLIQSDLVKIELGQEEESISKLVESKIIENWESQDKQSHLKTIRDRLLKDEDKAVSLLGLYQQILEGMESKESIEVGDNLSEVMALRLTGLVVSEEGRLFVYNQIYQRVFSAAWVAQELAKLRPYAVSLAQWLANDREDKYLLTGQGFLDVEQWSLTRRLTQEDSQYIAASRKLHTEEAINKAKKRAAIFSVIGVSGLIGSVIASGIAWTNFNEVIWRTRIEQASTEALSAFSEKSLEQTIAAIRVGRQLQQKVKDEHINNYPTYSPVTACLKAVTGEWYESNHFSIDKDESILAISANAKTIISRSKDGTAKILKQDGSVITKLKDPVINASISADGQTILSNAACSESENPATKGYEEYFSDFQSKCSTFSRIIKIWRLDGSLASTIKHQSSITSMRLSGDGKIIATGGEDGIINIWRQDGSLISSFKAHKSRVGYLRLSGDSQSILSGSDNAKLWKRDGSLISFIKNKDNFVGVDISDDGQTIASFDLNNIFDYTSDDFMFGDSGKYEISKKVKNGKIKLWRRDGSLATTITANSQSKSSVSMSSNAEVIASDGIDGTIQVWNRDGSLFDTFPGKEEILTVKVSANGQTIISSSNGTVKIWQRNDSLNSNLNSHRSIVGSVGISADGQTIVSGSSDNLVKVWRQDGTLIATLTGHTAPVTSVGISGDGKTIVSGSYDKTVRVWHFDLDYLLAKGCEQIEDYLNSHPKVNREELCPASLKGKISR
jgi:WD40 repeat protein